MNLYLLRHTRVAIPKGFCYGHLDAELADTFCEEAAAVKANLEGINFDYAYCSPLKRCVALANELSENAIADERIKEYNFGQWEGKSWDSIYALDEGKAWFDDYENVKTPQGESFQTMLARVRQFIDSLPKTDENILVVTHAGIIRAFLILLKGYTVNQAFDRKIAYGEITKVSQ